MATAEKKIQEFANCLEFIDSNPKELPQIFCFVSQDSFEFEEILQYYRERLSKSGEPFETIVFTGENGEIDPFFSHAFTPDMFFPTKLLIIKSGVNFFKPFFNAAKKANELHNQFLHHLPQLSEKVYILIHYENWDMPSFLKKFFPIGYALVHSKNFYSNETRKHLEQLIRKMDLSLSSDAIDEFLHRIPPNMGSYLKSLQKLKLYLHKKKFEIEDVQDVLLGRTSINYQVLVTLFFQNRKVEFYKEFSKLSDIRSELGILLSKLLDRLNEIRIFRIFQFKYKGAIPEDELFMTLGMDSYSSGRKYHIKKELISDAKMLKDKSIELLYESLIDLNIRHKSRTDADLTMYLQQKWMRMFNLFEI
ncbi:DNA polymerase III subunit delta [Leptospira sp. GIMC2001]|uniref:DNA polymerase III subunit delta n=1 Tax=Leptospira sp. GIMC2001 TaxID=1513297 RepID=UPI00234B71B7|nr:hypothetical protein [Leptospira sp. GIMC2001]WCL49531.1 hypothetical protein O4O04_01570 [Leptospira sp. GIMC2001]